jgi:hypothetical protein
MTVPVPVPIPTVPFVCPPTPTLAREEVANDQSKRVYPHNLRWVLFGTSLVGIIWAVAMGAQQFQNRTSDASQSSPSTKVNLVLMIGPSKLQVFDIVTGILYMVVALLEFYVFLVSCLVCHLLLCR